jgi:hypothetical protein
VRPLLTLAAALEDERNHVIPPPAPASDALEIEVELIEREPGEPGGIEALDADAEFAHVLHGGRAVVIGDSANYHPPERGPGDEDLSADDAEFLGLPGLLSAEQTAQLLSQRDSVARSRASTVSQPQPSPEVATWRAAAELRREVNRLVAVLAAKWGQPHAQLHSEVRRAVAGPASASASAELLERRRDHLLELLQR